LSVSQVSISQALEIAIGLHRAGRAAEAEGIYRQILSVDPNQAETRQMLAALTAGFTAEQGEFYYNLGTVLANGRRMNEAIASYERALALNPSYADAYYNLGNALAMTGRFEPAAACYRRVLELRPDHGKARGNLARASNDLGAELQRAGQIDRAIERYQDAVEIAPDFAEARSNLGNALTAKGRLDGAIAHCSRALALRPEYPAAHFNLGNALREKGLVEEAIACYRRAVALRPDYAEAHGNLGVALGMQGMMEEALACHRRALALRPESPEGYCKLAVALIEAGKVDDAVEYAKRAIAIDANFAEAYNSLGQALVEKDRVDEAMAVYRRALALNPGLVEAHNNLGLVLMHKLQSDRAIECFNRALALKPTYADAHNNLGNALLDTGRASEAIASYRKAVEFKPDFHQAHSNLVATLYFDPSYGPEAILEEHRRWARVHATKIVKEIKPAANDRNPDRRLRIGYASPNFRKHVVGLFLQRLFEKHDHERFDIVCFSDARPAKEDEVTARLKGWADEWHSTAGMSDQAMADLIREKHIDILVDLNLHMASERMLVFARKPAPVQVTYLAYAGTSGLPTMDYRFTDPFLDPPGESDLWYSEKSVRLRSYWCYRPWDQQVEVGELPARKAGYVTFGCLNNTAKVSEAALELWGEVMRAVPESKLIVSAFAGSPRERIVQTMGAAGIDNARLEFVGWMDVGKYLQTYNRIDIGLDPIPYNGGTTTCDAFWMGVPIVTLAGKVAVGRAGVTLLNQIGLPELIAKSAEEYVKIAADLSGDLDRLQNIRSEMRQRMEGSPLCDAEGFARDVEEKYRWMWREWCASGTG
jgi:protein O-GlcNAc transferase